MNMHHSDSELDQQDSDSFSSGAIDWASCDHVSFDPVAYINEPRWQNVSLGLDRVVRLMKLLGNPHLDFKVIHVAGTNGKGSVCAYLSCILEASGNKVGLFTSPYIERFEERIKVNSNDIDDESLLACTLTVKDAADVVEAECGEHPTEFELMFAVAMLYFARSGVDIAVVEVGLGGRLDATNVVSPELCVLTSIGLDHTAILGDTIELIAHEKAGIIKQGVPVVSWPQDPAALKVIRMRCLQLGCDLEILNLDDVSSIDLDLQAGVQSFIYKSQMYETQLLGTYQPGNASLAILGSQSLKSADLDLNITPQAICEGVRKTIWPGRFEIIARNPLVIVDGAHNPQGVRALAQTLECISQSDVIDGNKAGDALAVDTLHGAENVFDGMDTVLNKEERAFSAVFVMGVLADKDYADMIALLLPFAQAFIAYTPHNQRALPACDLASVISQIAHDEGYSINVKSVSTATAAVDAAVKEAKSCLTQKTGSSHLSDKESPESIIVAFGTLYSIAEIKSAVRLKLA